MAYGCIQTAVQTRGGQGPAVQTGPAMPQAKAMPKTSPGTGTAVQSVHVSELASMEHLTHRHSMPRVGIIYLASATVCSGMRDIDCVLMNADEWMRERPTRKHLARRYGTLREGRR